MNLRDVKGPLQPSTILWFVIKTGVNLRDVKVIKREEVVSQHKIFVCDVRVEELERACPVKYQPRMMKV